jgi:hypothetical protein
MSADSVRKRCLVLTYSLSSGSYRSLDRSLVYNASNVWYWLSSLRLTSRSQSVVRNVEVREIPKYIHMNYYDVILRESNNPVIGH